MSEVAGAMTNGSVRGEVRARSLGIGLPVTWLRGVAGVAVIAVAWEIVARTVPAVSGYLPPFSTTIRRLAELIAAQSTWAALGQSAITWVAGLVVGTLLAVPIGFAMGASAWLHRGLRVITEIFKPIPPVVFIPPMVLLLGTSQEMKIALVTYAVFWPVLMQAIAGIEGVDPVARRTAVAFRVGHADRLRFLVVPAAWPYVMTGLRIAASLALIATVVTELVGGAPGIGQSIAVAQINGQQTDVYALVLLTGLLGLAVNRTFDRLERTTLEWHSGRS